MKKINKIYIGIPESLRSRIEWVEREFRTNPRSHQKGGTDIIIVYDDTVLGYDWIDFPSKYIEKIRSLEYCEEIYARQFKSFKDKDDISFNKVWIKGDGVENISDRLKVYDLGYVEEKGYRIEENISLLNLDKNKKYFVKKGFNGFQFYIKVSDFVRYVYEKFGIIDTIGFLTTLKKVENENELVFEIKEYYDLSKDEIISLIRMGLVILKKNHEVLEEVKFKEWNITVFEYENGKRCRHCTIDEFGREVRYEEEIVISFTV